MSRAGLIREALALATIAACPTHGPRLRQGIPQKNRERMIAEAVRRGRKHRRR